MAVPDPEANTASPQRGIFATTHWSVVLAAGQPDSPQAAEALNRLCATYWFPVYAYVRRRGYGPEDAKDLTQEFFARFLAKNYLAKVDHQRARFRCYLLGALNHFLADAWDHAHRLKRAGAQHTLSIDAAAGESLYALEPVDELSPDRLFDRRWALALLEKVLTQLQREYEAGGKGPLFAQLSRFIVRETRADGYAQPASLLGMTVGAVRVAVHRLRRQYADLFLREVAATVSSTEQLRGEMRDLLEAVRG